MFHLAQPRHQGNEVFIYHPLSEGYFWAVLHSGDQKKSSNRGWILGVRQKSGGHIQVTRIKGYRWGVIHAVPDTLLRAWNTCLYVFLKAT